MNIPVAPARGQTGLRAVVILTLLLLVVLAFVPDEANPNPAVTALLLGLAALLGAVFWLAPRRLSYRLTEDALLVGKLTGPVRLPYTGLSARRASRGLGLKMGGTGLPGYYSGNYVYNADGLNNVLAAASNTGGGVLVTSVGRTFFLTPSDPDAFLRELAARGVEASA